MSFNWVSKPLVNHPGAENVENGVPTWAPTWGERIGFFDLGTLLAPSWGHLAPPNGPKTLQEAILAPSWDDFGAILVQCWCHFGDHFGDMLVPFWAQTYNIII